MSSIEPGLTASASVTVGTAQTAAAVGSGSLAVLATPALVALMEQAACACLEGRLELGQTSVGVAIEVAHTAASPVGARVTATAQVVAVDGRRVEFTVTAADGAGQVGHGTHCRVIVHQDRFLAKLATRA
ncbi:MAG: thioesterase family protein [Bifidobacteriaceae bacterium]|jgi:predicted thioesterase|nr:thioesterase family protein [Bifidobacteriaceae bacterium]